MADNLSKTEWDAGAEVASDDIGTIHYPRVKVTWGADGTANDASAVTALPVAFLRDAATHVDTTSTPLGISATYTTATFDSLTTGTFVTHHIYADQDGTHIFEQSTDGTNWETADSDAVLAGTPKTEAHIVTARYHRARFVNGGVAQGVFRHQLICRVVGAPHAMGILDTMNVILGDKTHNTSAPTAEAHEVIGAVAKAAAPTYTEGAVVMPRVTLAGDQAITLDGETVTLAAETTKVIGTVNVAAAQTIAVTNAGTFATQAVVAGDVAHDGVDSGNPAKMGAKAETSLAVITLVADGDRTNLYADADGALYSKPFSEGDVISERIADTTGTSTAFTNFGATASTRNCVHAVSVFNASATDGFLDFRDGAAGAVLYTVPLPKGGGAILPLGNMPYFRTTANTALAYDVSAALTTVYISVTGKKSKL